MKLINKTRPSALLPVRAQVGAQGPSTAAHARVGRTAVWTPMGVNAGTAQLTVPAVSYLAAPPNVLQGITGFTAKRTETSNQRIDASGVPPRGRPV